MDSGTFLLRFSDSELGGVTIGYVSSFPPVHTSSYSISLL